MGTVEGAAVGAALGGGASALAAAFTEMGIPKDSAIRYERDLRANKFLLIAHETAADVDRARASLAARGGQVEVYSH
jgi:uncharacterized membrane protein